MFSIRYRPLGIYTAFIAFTLLILFSGPVTFKNFNYPLVVSFIFAVWLMFAIGFILGARGHLILNDNVILNGQPSRIIIGIILLGCILTAWDVRLLFINGIQLNFGSIGQNYVDSYDGYVRGEANVGVLYILNVFSLAIQNIMIIFLLSYFPYIPNKLKKIGLFILILGVFNAVFISGKQKYFGDLIIFGSYAILVYISVRNIRISTTALFKIGSAFIVIFSMFSMILGSRYSAMGTDASNIGSKMNPNMGWDNESILILLLGPDLGFPIGIFLSYFTNGLNGLNIALHLEFEWTYFVGNSYSLSRIFESITGDKFGILNQTYPFKTSTENWGLDKWHTLFSWMASDITFPGVIFCSMFFGWFYGRIWISCLNNSNIYATALFIYLSLGLIFSLANNQIMHTLQGIITLLFLLALYLFTKDRILPKK